MPRHLARRIAPCLGALLTAAGLVLAADCRASGLSVEQLTRLVKVVNDKGTDLVLPPEVVAVLDLAPAQVRPAVKQVTIQADDATKHGFAPLNDGSGFFLLRRKSASDIVVFRVAANLDLVAAAREFGAARFVALPDDEAGRELAQEFAQWSRVLAPPVAGAAPAAPGGASPKP